MMLRCFIHSASKSYDLCKLRGAVVCDIKSGRSKVCAMKPRASERSMYSFGDGARAGNRTEPRESGNVP
jgi:hypothetical protein